jgi:hypothetical protein
LASDFQEKQRSYETERRKLHNTILELKGNIRVFCRVRPLLGPEVDRFGSGEVRHISVVGDKSVDIIRNSGNSLPLSKRGKCHDHFFDNVRHKMFFFVMILFFHKLAVILNKSPMFSTKHNRGPWSRCSELANPDLS